MQGGFYFKFIALLSFCGNCMRLRHLQAIDWRFSQTNGRACREIFENLSRS